MSEIEELASARWPLAVALSGSQDASLRAEAEACAERWHLPLLVRRPKAPLRGLLSQARTLVVLGQDAVSLWDSQGHVRGGPGLAALRIAGIEKGREEDPLQRIGELRPGERVLDATLGFGQDARVAARLVGPEGRVFGLEASLPLAVLAEASLRRETRPGSAPIDVEHGDSMSLLQVSAAGAFDVILFDPMFVRALASQPGFVFLRRYADPRPLTSEALLQAQRVARRLVLVKTARYTSALRSLGLRPERAARSAPVVWARVPTRPPS
jgi:16S rRNA (guanine1516-N2)-methyltransferase